MRAPFWPSTTPPMLRLLRETDTSCYDLPRFRLPEKFPYRGTGATNIQGYAASTKVGPAINHTGPGDRSQPHERDYQRSPSPAKRASPGYSLVSTDPPHEHTC